MYHTFGVLVRYTISCRLVLSLRVDPHSEPLPSSPPFLGRGLVGYMMGGQ